jgi:polyisoprenoid-binding protein YceI
MKIWGLLLLLAAAFPAGAETFQIDPVHSSVEFRIAHHVVGKVRGRFDKFEGSFDYVPGKPELWKASATIDANSINTGNETRDDDLRTAKFFDVKRCPTIQFVSDRASDVVGDKSKLHGRLTIHCVTRPVTLDMELGGTARNPKGEMSAGAAATTKINRKDFDMTFSKKLDAGGLMVGEEVEISLELEGDDSLNVVKPVAPAVPKK